MSLLLSWIRIRNLCSKYGSGSREAISKQIRMDPDPDPKHWYCLTIKPYTNYFLPRNRNVLSLIGVLQKEAFLDSQVIRIQNWILSPQTNITLKMNARPDQANACFIIINKVLMMAMDLVFSICKKLRTPRALNTN